MTDPVGNAKPGPGQEVLPDTLETYEYAHPSLKPIYAAAYGAGSSGSNGGTYPGTNGGAAPTQEDKEAVARFNNARLTDYALSHCK